MDVHGPAHVIVRVHDVILTRFRSKQIARFFRASLKFVRRSTKFAMARGNDVCVLTAIESILLLLMGNFNEIG